MSTDGDDDWNDSDAIEDDDDPFDDCGMMADGLCSMAGSEWCDWECPLAAMHARARIRAMKARSK